MNTIKLLCQKLNIDTKNINDFAVIFKKILTLNHKSLIKLLSIVDVDTKKFILNHIINQIEQEDCVIDWNQFTDSQLITAICQTILTKKQQIFKACKYKSFILNIPAFQNLETKESCCFSKESILENQKKLKKQFQRLVIKVLSSEMSGQDQCFFYRNLGTKVFSKMQNPLILSEFLLNKFKQNPSVQIQVLSSLFILVGKYGLELQNFYEKLEILIQSKHQGKSIYKLPNSRRFFKLVQSALKSSRVPLQTVSTLSKIIIQQIFEQQSQFAYWALSFIVNLVKKHRQLLVILSNAPEINLLKKHYSPKIRTLIKQLEKNLNKAQYLDIDKFSNLKNSKILNNKIEDLKSKLECDEQINFKIPNSFQPFTI